MDDRDLNRLKDIEIPEPSPAAKTRALDAAMLAFEDSQKKIAPVTQGVRNDERPMSTFIEKSWEWIMERRVIVGTVAASLLIFPLAGSLLWHKDAKHLLGIGRLADSKITGLVKQKQAGERLEAVGGAQTGTSDEDRNILLNNRNLKLVKPSKAPPKAEEKAADGAPVSKKITLTEADKPNTSTPATVRVARKDHAKRQLAPAAPAGGLLRDHQVASQLRSSELKRPLDQFRYMIPEQENRDRFASFASNPVKSVTEHPVSTFSIDVDTASYAFLRRMLQRGALPTRDAIRVEEMINYFSYAYPRPENAEVPFKASVALYPTPWNANTKLLHIGIKGHEIVAETKPRSNLVFLIDVSGSMSSRDKLPLLKSAFRLLVNRLDDEDSVAIVTYAGRAGTVLEPTKVKHRAKILSALEQLHSGGSTAGAQGIRQAYALAEQAFDKEGVNRVILATDGDFNVGITNIDQLKSYIETKRDSGIFLSVLGFGQGNYNDALMQTLAQNGNGNAAYIDTLREAQKVLVEEAGSTLFPIAKDVKIQIEFNPARVSEYRLIGYETRHLNRQDFNNDKVDAGDIGSGHTVTAIYEITPVGSTAKLIDDLRYQKPEAERTAPLTGEYAFLKLRYKHPNSSTSKLITIPVTDEFAHESISAVSADMRFAASVAAFGQKLRGETHLADYSYDAIHALASAARGTDAFGYRSEFLSLVRLAKSLAGSRSNKKR